MAPPQDIDCSVTVVLGRQNDSYGTVDGGEGPRRGTSLGSRWGQPTGVRYLRPVPGSSSVAPRESATKA
jgi:hypothetical protein